MTIHAAKGLEFPQVFIVGMEENLFPSQLSVNSREDLEEERRLFYVAVTRAMSQVTMSYALNRFRWGTPVHCEPSRFLAEINPDFLEVKTAPGMPSRKVEETKRTSPQHYAIPAGSSLKKINQQPVRDFQGDPISTFSPGCEVMHIKFGRGTILAIDGDEINKMATIRFQEGEKKLLLKFAKLSLIK